MAGLTSGRFVTVSEDKLGAAGGDADASVTAHGGGGVAQSRFATLDAGLALDNLDFFVT